MALFSQKQNKTVEKAGVPKVDTALAYETDRNTASVLVHPLVTEKSVTHQGNHVYTFLVRQDATKFMVRDAIIALYKVTPVKVNTVNKKPRTHVSGSRGRAIAVKGYKKAYVYLSPSDTINLA